jgi:hypothetical protein
MPTVRREKPLTRLADADPVFAVGPSGRKGIGLLFNCPIHSDECFTYVPFTNPLDGGPPLEQDQLTWARSGETFDTLSISPSIHKLGEKIGEGECEWHGFVTNGAFITCADSK